MSLWMRIISSGVAQEEAKFLISLIISLLSLFFFVLASD